MTKTDAPLCTAGCGQPTPFGYLCDGCTDKLRRDLRDVVGGLLDDLEVSYLRQARFSGMRALRSSDDVPLPWDERAATSTSRSVEYAVLRWARVVIAGDPAAIDLRRYLEVAAADVERAYAASRVGQARRIQRQITRTQLVMVSSMPAAARLLLERLPWLRQQQDAGDAFAELHKAVGRAVHVIDCPPAAIFAGICPGDWPEAEACGASLYGAAKAKQLRCPECNRLWNVDELRPYFVAQAREWLATATEISRALPALGELRATPERIRKWKERGRLQVRALKDDQPLYRVGDVEQLLSQDAATHARREAKREAV